MSAAYFRANFKNADERLSGNIGLRYVHTDQSTFGYAPDLDQIIFDQGGAVTIVPDAEPTTVDRSYDEWLPSLNVRYGA